MLLSRDLLHKLFVFSIEGIYGDMWRKIEAIQSEGLRATASQVPLLINAAYADSTLAKYKPAWEKWLSWADQYPEVTSLPADPFFIACYFNDLVASGCKEGTITSAFNGIRWGHLVSGQSASPTDHPFVKLSFEGAKRLTTKDKNQKEPFTVEIIKSLIKQYNGTNLVNLRFLLIVILGFAGFFRISELLSVQVKDIKLFGDRAEVFLDISKCDQLREGSTVYLARTGTLCCPVYWLDRYLKLTGLVNEPESYLICRLAKTKKGHNVLGHYPLSYNRAREIFMEKIIVVFGDDTKNYGLHSLRSGGATAAANNGTDERLIKKHGRWKSSCVEGYIKHSKSKRLKVSQSLGL